MRIDATKLNELYPSVHNYSNIFFDKPVDKAQFYEEYLSSKLWRLNNLYTIVDKQGDIVTFDMNFAQHLTYSSALVHPRIIVLKSRQQGISTLWLISFFDDAIFLPHTSIGLMAQGLDESEKLLERIKVLWDNMDPDILEFLGVTKKKENSKEFSFSNGSSIFVRTSFRSTTLQRLHISEYGKIANANPKRAKETKSGTLQTIAAGNTVVIESTAEGINDFKFTWDTSVSYEQSGQPMAPKDFKPVFLSWVFDPDCNIDVEQSISQTHAKYFEELEIEIGIKLTDTQKWFWIAQFRELGEETYQEYPATPEEAFRRVKDGTYYSRLYRMWVVAKGRERNKLYDPNLPVHCVFDLGIDDETVIIYYQLYRGELRIIDEYSNNGREVAHYCDVLRNSGYDIHDVELPWDAETNCLQTGESVLDSFNQNFNKYYEEHPEVRRINFNVQTKGEILPGIENVRKMIKIVFIDKACAGVIGAFLNYSKEWDEKKLVWKLKPKHDDHSHFGDALRYLANKLPRNVLEYRWGSSTVGNTPDTGVTDGMAI